MEITDEERRQVAARLREVGERYARGDRPWLVEDLMQALGFTSYEDGDAGMLRRLAELVDRPTCTMERDEASYYPSVVFWCSNCGNNNYDVIPMYCPNCGAEVVE